MKSINISDVQVPAGRQRKEFREAALRELAESLQKPHGQLNPIILRNDEVTLVCGERRLRAMSFVTQPLVHDGTLLPKDHLAYTTLNELTTEQLHEAELEENVQREDLTWQERVAAIADLHAFRKLQDPNRTAKETAVEIYGETVSGRKRNEVQKAIDLAQFLDDPLVAFAPDEKAARKAIRQELEHRRRTAAAASFANETKFHQLFHSSSYSLDLEKYKNFFDVILTDPPYGIDIHEKQTYDGDVHSYDDSDETFTEVLERLPDLSFKAARDDAHIYVFADIRRFTELFVAFELAGWTVWPRPLIWDKGTVGSYGNIEYGFRACYDAILFARKGDRKVIGGHRDVININQRTDHIHPAGKPIELYSELLKRSVYPGDRVADFLLVVARSFKPPPNTNA